MNARKVISSKNMPVRFPVLPTIVWWLFLDRLQAAGWVYGVIGTLLLIGWCAWAFDASTREEVEVLK